MYWHIIILAMFIFLLTGCEDKKYPSGRDTIKSFGDGRYQILESKKIQTLYDIQQEKLILDNITKWKRLHNDIFLMAGTNGPFVVLHLQSGTSEKFSEIGAIPEQIRREFEALKK